MGRRLKDADALIELIDGDIASLDEIDMPREGYDVCLCTLEMVKQYIKALPTVEQKHGRWEKDNGLYKCTVCNDLCTVAGWANCIPEEQMYKDFKYCPGCGARMDEVEE